MQKKREQTLLDGNIPFTTVIRAEKSIFDIHLGELFRYWDLVVMLFRRNITLQYKQTALGIMWLFLYPLLTSGIFSVIFGSFAGFSTDEIPTFLFYLAGNTLWWVFSNSFSNVSRIYQSETNLFSKVYFPRLSSPIAQVLTSFFSFGIRFLLIIAVFIPMMLAGSPIRITWKWLLIPLPMLQCGLLGLSLGVIVTSTTTKYRDMAMLGDFAAQLLMYATPVLYALSSTSGWIHKALMLNPLTPLIENYRYFLFDVGEFMAVPWLISWLITLVVTIFGVVLYQNVCKTCIDTI